MGKGEALEQVLRERKSVAEGVTSAVAISTLAKRLGIEMPITQSVSEIVNGEITIDDSINKEYEYGFVTDIEQDTLPPGLNEDVIKTISKKKDEPQWL